jgi:hypothetical protein
VVQHQWPVVDKVHEQTVSGGIYVDAEEDIRSVRNALALERCFLQSAAAGGKSSVVGRRPRKSYVSWVMEEDAGRSDLTEMGI